MHATNDLKLSEVRTILLMLISKLTNLLHYQYLIMSEGRIKVISLEYPHPSTDI